MPVPMKLVVIGQGYVGLPLSVRAVEVGYEVVGLDLDEYRISRLRSVCPTSMTFPVAKPVRSSNPGGTCRPRHTTTARASTLASLRYRLRYGKDCPT